MSAIAPMPVISRGLPAFASSVYNTGFEAFRANDADYSAKWRSAPPSTWPQWLAYDLRTLTAGQKASVRFHWYNESLGRWYLNTDSSFGVPGNYTIDGHASSGASPPADGDVGWTNIATVTGNILSSHCIDGSLTGFNWVRLRATASYAHDVENDVTLGMDIHDRSAGGDDHIAFIGDSIGEQALGISPNFADPWSANTFYGDTTVGGCYTGTLPNLSWYRLIATGTSSPTGTGPSGTGSDILDGSAHWAFVFSSSRGIVNIPQAVNLTSPNFPIAENHSHAGVGYAATGLSMMNQIASLMPTARIICCALGMNDASGGTGVYDALNSILAVALAMGVKAFIVATANWTNDATHNAALQNPLTGAATAVNPQIVKFRNDARAQGKPVFDGPDLWTKFFNHPEYLRNNTEIHPHLVADKMIQEMWADSLLTTYQVLGGLPFGPPIATMRGRPDSIHIFGQYL